MPSFATRSVSVVPHGTYMVEVDLDIDEGDVVEEFDKAKLLEVIGFDEALDIIGSEYAREHFGWDEDPFQE